MAPTSNRRSVLVVEDDRALNALLADLFDTDGYRVLQAYDGNEAYGVISRERPDVVLLDLMLPGMLGQDILRRAKSDPTTRAVHFVIMSAWPQSLTEADRKLIDAMFPKPFDVDRVLQTVESLTQSAA